MTSTSAAAEIWRTDAPEAHTSEAPGAVPVIRSSTKEVPPGTRPGGRGRAEEVETAKPPGVPAQNPGGLRCPIHPQPG